MRGVFSDQGRLFSYVSPEARVLANHPLRKIRKLACDGCSTVSPRPNIGKMPQECRDGLQKPIVGPKHD